LQDIEAKQQRHAQQQRQQGPESQETPVEDLGVQALADLQQRQQELSESVLAL
jgi:type IV secretory pathway VirD2 relaxase